MRRRWLLAFFGVALVIGVVLLPPAPTVFAGTNGQQLYFQLAPQSSAIGISWIRVNGNVIYSQSQPPVRVTFYKEFNPLVKEYRLYNWWWRDQAFVEYSVKYANGGGNYNWCFLDVPKNQTSNWVTVRLDLRRTTPGCEQVR